MKIVLLFLFVSGCFSLGDVFYEGNLITETLKRTEYALSRRGDIRPRLLCVGDDDLCNKYAFNSLTCWITEWKTLGETKVPVWYCRPFGLIEYLFNLNAHTKFAIEKPYCEPITDPPDGRFLKGGCSVKYRLLHKHHPKYWNGTHSIVAERTPIVFGNVDIFKFKADELTLTRKNPSTKQIICGRECPKEVRCTLQNSSKWNCKNEKGVCVKGIIDCEDWGEGRIVDGSCVFTVDGDGEDSDEEHPILGFFLFVLLLCVLFSPCIICCACCLMCGMALDSKKHRPSDDDDEEEDNNENIERIKKENE